jgi:hypothetical protein
MGTCDWLGFGAPQTVKSQGAETLKRVPVAVGEATYPDGSYDEKVPIKWGDPEDVYLLCSTSRPAIVHRDYSDKNKWIAQFLAPGYPDHQYSYLIDSIDSYTEYFRICHNVEPPQWKGISLARKFGYPPGLVLRASEVPISKPGDILSVRLPAPAPNQLDIAALNIEIVDFTWHKGGFDNVMVGTFTIENKNPFPVKDVTITCVMKAPSETILNEVRNTIYQIFEPDKRMVVRDFNIGFINNQSERAVCKVEGWHQT